MSEGGSDGAKARAPAEPLSFRQILDKAGKVSAVAQALYFSVFGRKVGEDRTDEKPGNQERAESIRLAVLALSNNAVLFS